MTKNFTVTTLAHLSTTDIQLIKDLSLPSSHFLLTEENCLAFQVLQNNLLIGVILAQIYEKPQTAQIFSFVIQENERQKKFGAALFAFCESYLINEKKILSIGFEYDINDPSIETLALEKILAKSNWPTPKMYLLRLHFILKDFNPAWYQKILTQKIKPQFEIFPWQNLKDTEKKQILYQEYHAHFPLYLSPLKNEKTIEYRNSLGLRTNDQLVGWCLTHPNPTNSLELCYNSFLINDTFRRHGMGFILLCQSIQLQKDLPIPYGVFEIKINEIDKTWKSFIKKRFLPFAQKVEKLKWAMKIYKNDK